MPNFYAGSVFGVLAGVRYQNGAEKYGMRKGFYVFVPSNGMLKLLYKGMAKISDRQTTKK